jgi:hypothetical protein
MLALLRVFAVTGGETSLHAALVHTDGTTRLIPTIDAAVLPATSTRNSDEAVVTSKVVGLIRGDADSPHEFILESRTRVQLPSRSPFTWDEIHLVLEAPHWLVGKLIRMPRSNQWTVDTNTKTISQAAMELLRKD